MTELEKELTEINEQLKGKKLSACSIKFLTF